MPGKKKMQKWVKLSNIEDNELRIFFGKKKNQNSKGRNILRDTYFKRDKHIRVVLEKP